MIGYVTLGTDDIPRAAAFYDRLLELVGAKRFMESDRFVAWGVAPDKPMLGVIRPFDKKPASAGNGVMVALVVDSPEKVQALHAGRWNSAPRTKAQSGRAAIPDSMPGIFATWTATSWMSSAWCRSSPVPGTCQAPPGLPSRSTPNMMCAICLPGDR